MSQDAERVRKLVTFKEKLAKKVEELEAELKEQQALLETVNSILLEKGFKRAEITKQPPTTETPQPEQDIVVESEPSHEPAPVPEDVIQLKTVTGELLAILQVTQDSLRTLPAGDKDFNVNTPPFTQFLVERVLAKMQERDTELVRAGQLSADRMFSYNIIREGDIIREVMIKNVDTDRLRELKSSIRWTLEKMCEKMRSQG